MVRNTLLAGIALLSLSSAPSSAAVVIGIEGVAGSGVTTITFSGSSVTTAANSLFTTGVGGWSEGSAFQPIGPNDEQFLSDPTIQDVRYDLTGNVTITIGSQTRALTQIFLDEDGGDTNADDFGLRVGSALSYASGEAVTFSGSGTIALDISAFNSGRFSNTIPAIGSLAPAGDVSFVVGVAPVPLPAGAFLLIGGLGALSAMRRRT
jgi:hypothetical protein